MAIDLNRIGQQNLSCLPGSIFLKLKSHLNVGGWRTLLAEVNQDDEYRMRHNEIYYEGKEDPTTELLNELKAQDMTIAKFVECAMNVQDYFILGLFNVRVPVQIIENPPSVIEVELGHPADISIEARGCPPPNYQWYKNDILLMGATSKTFHIMGEETDSGHYCCAVYNSDDLNSVMLSQPSQVTVVRPVFSFLDQKGQVADLEIKENPRSCIVTLDSNAVFKCEVWSRDGMQVTYQWFRDETPLTDSEKIKGSNSSELRLYNINSTEFLGCYSCHVSNRTMRLQTEGAVLQISDLVQELVFKTKCQATDKVALLIGCSDYRSDSELKAPKYDVQTLSNIFQSLSFKVVSLLNLSKLEITAAVHEFQQLVGPGVYCVFYFCGHGFQVHNQCFLVPTDAPLGYRSKDCIPADAIFNKLSQREPQICCMILDICRKTHNDDIERPAMLSQPVVKKGNHIVCYGTSFGMAAYEENQYGILVSHLKNILSLPINIESVFQKLRKAIYSDSKVYNEKGSRQIPEIISNLQEIDRSFTDPIVYTGHTDAFQIRQRVWEMAHRKPDPRILEMEFPGFVVRVRLAFQQEFSNVLKIFVSVEDPGLAKQCYAFVSGVPPDVAERAKVVTIAGEKKMSQTYVAIQNIQRLKDCLKIRVTVECKDLGLKKDKEISDLGRPLVAQLKLWEEREDLCSQRVAEEVEEDSDDYESNLEEDLQQAWGQ